MNVGITVIGSLCAGRGAEPRAARAEDVAVQRATSRWRGDPIRCRPAANGTPFGPYCDRAQLMHLASPGPEQTFWPRCSITLVAQT